MGRLAKWAKAALKSVLTYQVQLVYISIYSGKGLILLSFAVSEIEHGVGWLVVLVQTRPRAAALTKMGIIAKHSGNYSAKWNFASPSLLGVLNHRRPQS